MHKSKSKRVKVKGKWTILSSAIRRINHHMTETKFDGHNLSAYADNTNNEDEDGKLVVHLHSVRADTNIHMNTNTNHDGI